MFVALVMSQLFPTVFMVTLGRPTAHTTMTLLSSVRVCSVIGCSEPDVYHVLLYQDLVVIILLSVSLCVSAYICPGVQQRLHDQEVCEQSEHTHCNNII